MKKTEDNKFPYVVIGTSAGGLRALIEFVSQLSENINAAVFIVSHLPNTSLGTYIAHTLQKHTSYQCKLAVDKEKIRNKTIYIAPPNYHLLIKKNQLLLGNGPEESRWKPSIDVLFRSAAVAYGWRVIGIILTGLLSDGVAGMLAIRKCGGICVVQSPEEAEFNDMPLAVLNQMEVDFNIPIEEMGNVIAEGVNISRKVKIPKEVQMEAKIAEKTSINIKNVSNLGENSIFACPKCGGGLWEIKDDSKLQRYRCHIGHTFYESDLLSDQQEATEASLWVALRMMEERRNLFLKIGNENRNKGLFKVADIYFQKEKEVIKHIDRLKELLYIMQKDEI